MSIQRNTPPFLSLPAAKPLPAPYTDDSQPADAELAANPALIPGSPSTTSEPSTALVVKPKPRDAFAQPPGTCVTRAKNSSAVVMGALAGDYAQHERFGKEWLFVKEDLGRFLPDGSPLPKNEPWDAGEKFFLCERADESLVEVGARGINALVYKQVAPKYDPLALDKTIAYLNTGVL